MKVRGVAQDTRSYKPSLWFRKQQTMTAEPNVPPFVVVGSGSLLQQATICDNGPKKTKQANKNT